jgi:adenine-specific DNA-methyltransferase
MNIKDLVINTSKLSYKELCATIIEKLGAKQPVKWDSVLPHEQQQSLFGGEILRLMADHPTLANQKEVRPICLMKGEISQLLFFYVQIKDETLPKAVIERITRKFVGGAAADRYIIWFFGNNHANILKIVISGKEGKKIRLKTLSLEAEQWFKTYDFILNEVERKFNTGGLFQSFKEPSGLWKAIWEAFDISIVNKKFYAEIKEVFDMLVKEELLKCKGILTDEKERVQFAIRLIGRIIFCWFLRRKAIITDDVLSSRAVVTQQNYYRDLLELLFFEVFNTPLKERKKDLPDLVKDYPFLNGGLFEPQRQDYKGNWVLNISNEWFIHFFSNTLERYNFTVDENSAASSEIAIDPEMLGRIFENLLAEHNPETGESARKATGSYYTPREIVDFMVEESLIAYLKTLKDNMDNLILYPLSQGVQPISDEAIEDFVHIGILPDSLKPYSKNLLDKLNAIKVLDPACGSGAFLISMLQKLIVLKHQIEPQASLYELKLKTIENSIYGVDIQPMATELSRLRCWLSLIVDEDPRDIKPLPNLDFKFVTANSLIDLGYDEFIHKVETGKIGRLYLTNFISKLGTLRDLRQKYFDSTMSQTAKDKLKKEFNAIKDELFKMSLDLITQRLLDAEFATKITKWNPFDDSEAAPFFNKEWMYGVEDGFDIVIANPPYVGEKGHKEIFRAIKKSSLGNFYQRKLDLFYFFFHLALNLCTQNGNIAFISTNYFITATAGKKLRQDFKERAIVKNLINFNELKIFKSALGQHNMITILEKGQNETAIVKTCMTQRQGIATTEILQQILHGNNTESYYSETTQNNLYDGDEYYIRLDSSSEMSSNPVQIILDKVKNQGVSLGTICNVNQGLRTGADKVSANHIKDLSLFGVKKDEGIYILKKKEMLNLRLNQFEKSKIKSLFKNSDIARYYCKTESDFFLIDLFWPNDRDIDIKTIPNLMNHLKKYEAILSNRKENANGIDKAIAKGIYWFASVRRKLDFETEKIISPQRSRRNTFAYNNMPWYASADVYFITKKDKSFSLKYILALLNSKLYYIWLYHKGKMKGETLELYQKPLSEIPIKRISSTEQDPFIKLVDQILSAKQKDPNTDTSNLEKQIDEMIYKLYGLTPEEIAIVEGQK